MGTLPGDAQRVSVALDYLNLLQLLEVTFWLCVRARACPGAWPLGHAVFIFSPALILGHFALSRLIAHLCYYSGN